MKVYTLGRIDLPTAIRLMSTQIASSSAWTDQIWLCEHPPTFTQGVAGKAEHLLSTGSIPVIQTNRGGQVTFHGPGQVVAYPLLDLKSLGYFVKEFIYRLEEAAIRTLMDFGITGYRVAGAPGIYVDLSNPSSHKVRPRELGDNTSFDGLGKIAALGIKVSNHKTYHGLALNVGMDLEPYQRINPCGYQGLQTVDMRSLGVNVDWNDAAQALSQHLVRHLTP